MKKPVLYSILLAGLTLNLFFGAQIYLRSASVTEENDPRRNLRVFITVLEEVMDEHVDGGDFTYQALIRAALKGMLSSLDPYSEFMTPQRYGHLQRDTEGSFGGVGIVITLREGELTVVEPMEDTPALRAGILPGDQIVAIDGESTEGFLLEDAVKRLRGEFGEPVVLTILRPSLEKPFDVELRRAEIKVHKVKDLNGQREFPVNGDGIGYVRLQQFDEQTSRDLERALDQLERQGMTSLVLDLRGNPGGLLEQAVKVCDKFLPKGELIVSTEGRSETSIERFHASSRRKHPYMPMVVLVDRNSASASEIVAGCLQDTGRAIVVGETTYGKASVQKIVPLEDGAAIRLTTAKYYTPSHRVIHGKGIPPDIEVVMTEEERQALFLKRMPGGVEHLDHALQSVPEARRERLRQLVRDIEDRQLGRAMDLLRALRVYSERQPTVGSAQAAAAL